MPGYGQYEPVGWYGQAPEMSGYGQYEPVGWYGQAPEMSGYGQYEPVGWYGQAPEMPGYGQYEPLAEGYQEAAYGEPDFAAYVRDARPSFNPGCPMPTNVAGFEETPPLEGYVRPRPVTPTCERFTPEPGPSPSPPDTFKALW
jgi:hypothetical protein